MRENQFESQLESEAFNRFNYNYKMSKKRKASGSFEYSKKSRRASAGGMDVDKKQDMEIARLKKQLRMASPEGKYFTVSFGSQAIVSSATWAASELTAAAGTLFCPIQGTGINNRIGRKALLKKLRLHGIVKSTTQNLAGVNPHDVCPIRILLVHNREAAATVLSPQDVVTAMPTAALAPYTFQSTDSLGRYVVLKDKFTTLQNPNTWFDQTTAKDEVNAIGQVFKFSYKFSPPLEVNFNALNGGTVGDVVNHSFHLMAVAHNQDFNPVCEFVSRAYYTDV